MSAVHDGLVKKRNLRYPFRKIFAIRQIRKTFKAKNIHDLAESIAREGLVHLPTVGLFDQKGFEYYLELTNEIYNDSLPEKLTIDMFAEYEQDGQWCVIITGECRLRACQILWDEGCENCRSGEDDYVPGACFIDRFGGEDLPVDISYNPDPYAARRHQIEENMHDRPPASEEAVHIAAFIKLIRHKDTDCSLEKIAEMGGFSVDRARDAFNYDHLPLVVKQAVDKNTISYGIALQLCRLQRAGISSDEIIRQLATVIRRRPSYTVGKFSEVVQAKLDSIEQRSLEEMMEMTSSADEKRLFRQSFKAEYGNALVENLRWAQNVEFLLTRLLEAEDSPLLDRSNLEQLRVIATAMGSILNKTGQVVENLDGVVGPQLERAKELLLSDTITSAPAILRDIDELAREVGDLLPS